jgi:hypothetical protein
VTCPEQQLQHLPTLLQVLLQLLQQHLCHR